MAQIIMLLLTCHVLVGEVSLWRVRLSYCTTFYHVLWFIVMFLLILIP